MEGAQRQELLAGRKISSDAFHNSLMSMVGKSEEIRPIKFTDWTKGLLDKAKVWQSGDYLLVAGGNFIARANLSQQASHSHFEVIHMLQWKAHYTSSSLSKDGRFINGVYKYTNCSYEGEHFTVDCWGEPRDETVASQMSYVIGHDDGQPRLLQSFSGDAKSLFLMEAPKLHPGHPCWQPLSSSLFNDAAVAALYNFATNQKLCMRLDDATDALAACLVGDGALVVQRARQKGLDYAPLGILEAKQAKKVALPPREAHDLQACL